MAKCAPASLSTITELTEPGQVAPNQHSRNIPLLKIRQKIDIQKEPVGQHDQPFHRTVQQHFKIALESSTLVVHVRQNVQVGDLVQRIFNSAKDQGAEWSVMSNTITPTVWFLLLRRNREISFGW